jgi:RNA polymerase sigma factor (sigma-70 family)
MNHVRSVPSPVVPPRCSITWMRSDRASSRSFDLRSAPPPEGSSLPIGTTFPEVLAAAQAGAGWAFEVLYQDLAPALTGYLRLHGAVEPDDLASETFIGVFRGLGAFRGDEAGLRAWVFTIARRRLVDDWRHRGRRPLLADDGADELRDHKGGDVEEDALAVMGSRTVLEVCARLPDDQRDVLLLRILADLTVEQVAAVLRKTVPAVKALQRRGLATLRGEIRDLSELAAPS